MAEKYLKIKSNVNGFSFANLGIFKGFCDGILNSIWALVLLGIFGSSALVGVYTSVYFLFYMLITLLTGEMLKLGSKAKLLYISMVIVSVCYFMMAFSIKPATFIALDFISAVPWMLISSLISLFMADFATKNVGMARLNGRFIMWTNMGALIAPIIAMFIADNFGVRMPFMLVAIINLAGLIYFKHFGIIQEEKRAPKIRAKQTLKSIWKTTVGYFKNRALTRAYIINFGQYAVSSLRHLYVPIMVVEMGFSKELLGYILTIGILPYILLATPLTKLAQKIGKRAIVATGFLSFAVLSFTASMSSGWTLLAIFVLWQISGAMIEPLTDMYYFDAVRGKDRDKYFGIFKTVNRLPRFIVPLLGAGCITLFGGTASVWVLTGFIAAITGIYVLKKN